MSKLNERGGSKTQNQDVEDVRTAEVERDQLPDAGYRRLPPWNPPRELSMTHFEGVRIRHLPPDEDDNHQFIGGWRKHYDGKTPFPKGQSVQKHQTQRRQLAADTAKHLTSLLRSSGAVRDS